MTLSTAAAAVRFKPDIVEILRQRAAATPARLAFSYLIDGEDEEARLSYGELDRRARSIAAQLQIRLTVGDRALILCPPGLEFIAAFFACLYAGLIAVPVSPLRTTRKDHALLQLLAITADARPRAAITTGAMAATVEKLLVEEPGLRALDWLTVDDICSNQRTPEWPNIEANTIAFLQYTSGSTHAPKGVMVTHGALVENERMIQAAFGHNESTVGVSWLPLNHDMGLIGKVLQPVFIGGRTVLMSPVHFLQRPIRWLKAISRFRATTSGGPNFAYDLCSRSIADRNLRELDLASWDVAFNGAERVHSATLNRFAERFGACGFRREALYPCYGLAEATLIVSGGAKGSPPTIRRFPAARCPERTPGEPQVSCGRAILDGRIVITDPSGASLPPEAEGEIWVAGHHVAAGYWNDPSGTQAAFQCYLRDSGEGPFLRTGDTGFVADGELYVTGRISDRIILRGRNHDPGDLEYSVQQSHTSLELGATAAFVVHLEDGDALVVVQEVPRTAIRVLDKEEVTRAVRESISQRHGLALYDLVLVPPAGVPKTSSGKVRRFACRDAYLAGKLPILFRLQGAALYQRFAERASSSPAAAAIVSPAATLSFCDLRDRIDRLAGLLQRRGLGRGAAVGICLAATELRLIAVLAVAKIGGCAVLSKAARALADVDAVIVAEAAGTAGQIDIREASVVEPSNAMAASPDENAVVLSIPDGDLSLTQRDLMKYFQQLDRQVGCRIGDRWLSQCEDLEASAVLELLWALTHGAALILLPAADQGDAPCERQPAAAKIDFSLLYFSSNASDYADDKYRLVIEAARFADAHDFTAVWMPERHFHAFGGLFPNPSVIGAALAMATRRVRLRAGSVVLPLHHPLRVAEEWAVVDNLSQGRVDLAFARGWNPRDFVFAPGNYAKSQNVLFSHIETVRRLWRGEKIVLPDGNGNSAEIGIFPLPMQHELRLWITCTKGAERFAEAGACGANVLTALLFQSTEELAGKIAAYREARLQHGYDPAAGQVTLMLHTFVGPDLKTVRAKIRDPFLRYLEDSVDLWRFGSPSLDQLSIEERTRVLDYAFEKYFYNASLFGTVDSCLQRVQGLREIGVDEIACLIDFGVDFDSTMEGLERLNALRGLVNGSKQNSRRQFGHWRVAVGTHSPTVIQGDAEILQQLIDDPALVLRRQVTLLPCGRDADQVAARGASTVAIVTATQRRKWRSGPTAPFPSDPDRYRRASERPDAFLLRRVRDIIVGEVGATLHIPVEEITLDRSWHSFGVDSVKAIEIMDRLSKAFAIELSPVVLFDSPSLGQLTERLVADHGSSLARQMGQEPRSTAATPARARGNDAAGTLDTLSATELAKVLADELDRSTYE